MLADGDGFDVAHRLGARGVKARLVLFTGHDHGLVLARSALGDGVRGLSQQELGPGRPQSCLQTVAAGGYWMNGPAEAVAF